MGRETEGDCVAKTIEDYFADWEGSAFGFGYGTGEFEILPELKKFMAAVGRDDSSRGYDYEKLEAAVGAPVAWLFINALCKVHAIGYGTSPRYGWLEPPGERLKQFIDEHSANELYEICVGKAEDYVPCYPTDCNCNEEIYVEGVKCANPFWHERYGRG